MQSNAVIIQHGRTKQLLHEDSVHHWYRFVLSFPDHLVGEIVERFGIQSGQIVLDPFCGTGTTLVECKKLGIDAIGIEANPACALASQVKTNWNIDLLILQEAIDTIVTQVSPISDTLTYSQQALFATAFESEPLKHQLLANSPEGRYFVKSGMLEKGWLSEIPFYKSLAILDCIKNLNVAIPIRDLLKLALVAVLVEDAGNVSFGPEIYISRHRENADVLGLFRQKVELMVAEIAEVQAITGAGHTQVIIGDARECTVTLCEYDVPSIDFVITSPPYPTEKDYTRQTRMELVFLGQVHDAHSLRNIKQLMVRSHSKGIYKTDRDGLWVANIPEVQVVVDELREKIKEKTYGFAKLYPRIIEEYFGGIARHLYNLWDSLTPGGQCAYVLGEQRTYLRTYTQTGMIVAQLAERIGYDIEELQVWRVRKGTTGSGEEIKEEILFVKKPHKKQKNIL